MKKRITTVATVATLTTALAIGPAAFGFVQPKGAERPLEVESGHPVRTSRAVVQTPPAQKAASVARFAAAGFANLSWDADTQVPSRMWGQGTPAPGASSNPQVAEQFARSMLATHLTALAPGASLTDFVVVANQVVGGVRSVGFRQYAGGLQVLGGQVSFSFKFDRLVVMSSQALPNVTIAAPAQLTSSAQAQHRARAVGFISAMVGSSAKATGTLSRAVLPLVRSGNVPIEYRVVDTITVKTTSQPGEWEVYVDAATGAPIARRNKLLFADATVRYHVPERWPGGTFVDVPAANLSHVVDGTATVANGNGMVNWGSGVNTSILFGLSGPELEVSGAGAPAANSGLLTVGGIATWDVGADKLALAHLTSAVSVNRAKVFARANGYHNTAYLNSQIPVFVNEEGECNAYSNGDDIHFFPDGGGCESTGTMPDVVYHEYGHSLHIQGIIDGVGEFDSAFSEGIGDFLAASLTGDPKMGRGFFLSEQPLRDIDPDGSEAMWPEDQSFDPHITGLIIAGALWDMRKLMITNLGATEGALAADQIMWALMARSTDLPSTFVEALLADDDDGNLANGTPNECAIKEAFSAHGLGDSGGASSRVGTPTVNGLTVTVPVTPASASLCPGPALVSAELQWRLPNAPSETGTVTLTQVGENWEATIPAPAADGVVEYKIVGQLENGSSVNLPNNNADPYYQLYSGELFTVWCESFDNNPTDWTIQGGQWEWAAPILNAAGDPTAAFTGTNFFGTDINVDGFYHSEATTSVTTPVIDVTGYTGIRLQYRRWLTVEDSTYDKATISAGGLNFWTNAADGGSLTHLDREWRFQDVDLNGIVANNQVQVSFGLASDGGLEFGGWNVDDVCIMARTGPAATCGDGVVAAEEMCDDGNTTSGDGCSATCIDETVGGGGCCETGSEPTGAAVLGFLAFGLLVMPRRRRHR